MSSQVITALYDRYDHASEAVAKLEANGVPHSDISIVANNEGDQHSKLIDHVNGNHDSDHHEAKEGAEKGAGVGASLGTVLGGAAGLLTGLGLMAIPGVGPVVAAGWLVATVTGAGIGAAAGGLVGSLAGAGINESDAHTYSEGVKRGGTLVTVRADDTRATGVMDILEKHGSVDVTERAQTWRSEGWTGPAVTEDSPPGAARGAVLSPTSTVEGRKGVRSYSELT